MPAPMHTQHAAAAPERRPDDDTSRRGAGASLLLWLLLLIAVVATAWYFLGLQEDSAAPAQPVSIGDAAPETSRSPVSESVPSADATARERATPVLPDRDALPLNRPAPAYPAAAQRGGEQGTVLLQVEVGADGRPDEVSLARGSGSRDLDRAALEAVRGWTFEPAIRDGEPVASSVQVPVEFRLQPM